ncbi:MAG: hypothetical protein M3R25_10915, partial [Bacteroidota bacterium]|nr:hypothetical protein [Bacteroidota bacterium]
LVLSLSKYPLRFDLPFAACPLLSAFITPNPCFSSLITFRYRSMFLIPQILGSLFNPIFKTLQLTIDDPQFTLRLPQCKRLTTDH